MINLSYKSCRFSFLLYLVLAVPFIYNTEPLLAIWLKEVPEWAALFCQLQVVRTLFEQLFTPLRMSLMAQGSIKQVSLIDLIIGVATFLLLWMLYELGFAAQWHYYISIILLVFVSGIIKVYLCHRFCDMRIGEYVRTVVLPCVMVMIASVITAQLLQLVLHNVHFLLLVTIQVTMLFAIEVLFGLNRTERRTLLYSIKSYKR